MTAVVRTVTDVEEAAAALRRGGLVGVPTETVYGLAADATNPNAVARVFEVKGRPRGHPLIVHIAEPAELHRWSEVVPPTADRLAALAWPGPITVVVPAAQAVDRTVTGGRDTVALRMPAHPVMRELLAHVGRPLAAPSANRFGSVSPTTAAHVLDDLAQRLDPQRDLVLDGGPADVGLESTIIDCTVDPPQLLRVGGLPAEQVERLLGGMLAEAAGPSRASGMLPSHYAPRAAVVVVDDTEAAISVAERVRRDGRSAEVLDAASDPVVVARTLYAELRRLDRAGVDVIVAIQPPAPGLGVAIRDRLAKAAAPRPHGR